MPTVQEQIRDLEGKIAQRQDELARIFEEAGPELEMDKVKCISGDSVAKVEHIRALNDELADLRKQLDEKRELLQIASEAVKAQAEPERKDVAQKDIGALFVESLAYKHKGETAYLDLDVKTLMQRSAGWEPEVIRSGLVVEQALRPVQLLDVIPTQPVGQSAYKYMEETVATNNATEVTEGNAYGEAALTLEEKSAVVEKIGVYLPITDEQLEDVPSCQAYVNNRLGFFLRQRLDGQILNGTGSTPYLQGVLNLTGIQTQAKSTDPIPDAIYKAAKAVRVTGRAVPNIVVMHPTDWQSIRLLKTGEGVYIWGNPAEAGPETIWGMRVVQCDAFTASGTAVVGDFANHCFLGLRRGVEVQVTNAHEDYFVKGKQCIRADLRAVMVWLRPAAFCKVTGLS